MIALNETHDPALRSWVVSANLHDTDFPLQNLPFAVFRRAGTLESWRPGVAIGDQILDLAAAREAREWDRVAAAALDACQGSELNALMALGTASWSALRLALSRALRAGSPAESRLSRWLVAQAAAEYKVPARIGDYTDFYTSIHHATAVGRLFRPEQPLLPNYKWVPIGYHGRSSSIVPSGAEVRRPIGQVLPQGNSAPEVRPSARLDYELELGAFIGPGNALGSAITVDAAEEQIFGLCLLNDWSARDLQSWEYQPLGPFLAKSFCTQISPWIVTLEALAPYRAPWLRADGDPQPLGYLDSARNREQGAFHIALEVALLTASMRERRQPPALLGFTSYRHAYWTLAQMVAHHTINGCNLQPGDLLGTGTQSGPGAGEEGSLLERTRGGKVAVALPNGEFRTFLEDGDTVILRGCCARPGASRIGFGELTGTVVPAPGQNAYP